MVSYIYMFCGNSKIEGQGGGGGGDCVYHTLCGFFYFTKEADWPPFGDLLKVSQVLWPWSDRCHAEWQVIKVFLLYGRKTQSR